MGRVPGDRPAGGEGEGHRVWLLHVPHAARQKECHEAVHSVAARSGGQDERSGGDCPNLNSRLLHQFPLGSRLRVPGSGVEGDQGPDRRRDCDNDPTESNDDHGDSSGQFYRDFDRAGPSPTDHAQRSAGRAPPHREEQPSLNLGALHQHLAPLLLDRPVFLQRTGRTQRRTIIIHPTVG